MTRAETQGRGEGGSFSHRHRVTQRHPDCPFPCLPLRLCASARKLDIMEPATNSTPRPRLPRPHPPGQCLGPAADSELNVQCREVIPDRSVGQPQSLSQLLVRIPRRESFQQTLLLRCQLRPQVRGHIRCRRSSRSHHPNPQQTPRPDLQGSLRPYRSFLVWHRHVARRYRITNIRQNTSFQQSPPRLPPRFPSPPGSTTRCFGSGGDAHLLIPKRGWFRSIWRNVISRYDICHVASCPPGNAGLEGRSVPAQNLHVLDLTPFQNLRLEGGFVLVEARLTSVPLLDPVGRTATAETVIRGRNLFVSLRADLDERELSIAGGLRLP